MIRIAIQGRLRLAEQLQLLALSRPEWRRLHGWLAGDLQRAMRRAVRAQVEDSPLELFDGDERVRKRKARSFAAMVARRATMDAALLYDTGQGHRFRKRRTTGATEAQALRLRELGFTLSKRTLMRRFTPELAGYLIRKIETARGIQRRRLRKTRSGSLLLLVWREHGEEILAAVDPAAVFRRFITARLRAA